MIVHSIRAGKIATLSPPADAPSPKLRTTKSGYSKTELDSPVQIGPMGIDGDEHVYRDHGGVDAALCVYPIEHHLFWAEMCLDPGRGDFGENLSVSGLLEDEATIGMRLQAPSGLIVEISEPRAPCFKIAVKFGFKAMPLIMAREGNTGWMMRVLQPGELSLNDAFEVVNTGSDISVAEANRVLNHDKKDFEGAARILAEAPRLSDVSKRILKARL